VRENRAVDGTLADELNRRREGDGAQSGLEKGSVCDCLNGRVPRENYRFERRLPHVRPALAVAETARQLAAAPFGRSVVGARWKKAVQWVMAVLMGLGHAFAGVVRRERSNPRVAPRPAPALLTEIGFQAPRPLGEGGPELVNSCRQSDRGTGEDQAWAAIAVARPRAQVRVARAKRDRAVEGTLADELNRRREGDGAQSGLEKGPVCDCLNGRVPSENYRFKITAFVKAELANDHQSCRELNASNTQCLKCRFADFSN
jgi:hypothetical protein